MKRNDLLKWAECALALALFTAGCSGNDASPASGPTALSTVIPAGSEPTSTLGPTTSTTTPAVATTEIARQTVDPYAVRGWVARENALAGTDAWRIADDTADPYKAHPDGWVEGYADASSAISGTSVTLFVDTPAPTFTVDVFRMGWYDGDRARLITTTGPIDGKRQAAPVLDRSTGMAEAHWTPSLALDVDETWPPGAYLIVLRTAEGGAHYVPLTVRHEGTVADLTIINAVSTWQAYNPWGGCTLYDCFGNLSRSRADIVSFDRPYSPLYGRGSADFLTHELPLIAFTEQQGIDVDYITSIDLHDDPTLALQRNGLVSTGHDEYYSAAMRGALVDAVDGGTNVAFFGANAVYRNVRFEPGADGRPDRRMANFRSSNDPGATGSSDTTVNWREAPLLAPESEIVGIEYGCAGVHADWRVAHADHWLFGGSGAVNGQRVKGLVGVEFDQLAPATMTPDGVEVIAASPVTCRDRRYQQVSAYRATASGGGVFAAGTIDWNCGLDGSCPAIERSAVVRSVTANVLFAFARPLAGKTHPSADNTARHRVALGTVKPTRPSGPVTLPADPQSEPSVEPPSEPPAETPAETPTEPSVGG